MQTKAGLLELRKALKANKGYVLGEFSYADVTMAVALQAVEPVGPPISKYAQTALIHRSKPYMMPIQCHALQMGRQIA